MWNLCTRVCTYGRYVIPRIRHAVVLLILQTSKPPSLIRPIHRPTHIPNPHHPEKHHHLEEEPLPTASLPLPIERLPPALPFSAIRGRKGPLLIIPFVDILVACRDGDDVVIIT